MPSLSSLASVSCQLWHLLEYFVLHLIVSGLMAMMARRSLPPGQSRSGRPTWNSFCEYLDPWGARNNSMQQLYAKCTVMHPYPLMSLFIFGFYVVNKCSLNIIQTWISAAANRPPISQAESWLIPSLGTNLSILAVFFSSHLAGEEVRQSLRQEVVRVSSSPSKLLSRSSSRTIRQSGHWSAPSSRTR